MIINYIEAISIPILLKWGFNVKMALWLYGRLSKGQMRMLRFARIGSGLWLYGRFGAGDRRTLKQPEQHFPSFNILLNLIQFHQSFYRGQAIDINIVQQFADALKGFGMGVKNTELVLYRGGFLQFLLHRLR